MRKPFIAGNWKMNMNSTSSIALAAGLAKELENVDTVDVAVCPAVCLCSVGFGRVERFEHRRRCTGRLL